MKLKAFLMMAIITFCMVACSDDEEVKPLADSVVGTYSGTLDMTVAGNSAGSSELSVEVTRMSDATLSVVIVNKTAATGGMSIHRIAIEDITVADAGNSVYTLSKVIPEEGLVATDIGSENKTVWTFKSFSGSVDRGTIQLNMVAQPGAMPMPITMVFAGTK